MNPSLNGYRAFAFLAVFLFHINVFPAGYLGVQAFFVLSGFLITPILLSTKEKTMGFKEYLKNFMIRRVLRIFPLYYFYLGFLACTIAFFGLTQLEYFDSLNNQLIYGFTYTYNFYHSADFFEHNRYITHFWSLAVEEQFYLIWPLLIYFVSKRHLKKMLVFIILLGPVLRLLIAFISSSNALPFLSSNENVVVYVSTLSHLDAFAIGGLASVFIKKEVGNFVLGVVVSSVIALGLITNYIASSEWNFSTLGYGPLMKNSYKYIWGFSLVNIICSLILLRLKSRNLFRGIIENKLITYIGLISYGLYVYHYGLIHICKSIHEYCLKNNIPGVPESPITYQLGAFILTLLVSSVSYFFFELWFIKLKDKIAPKSKKNPSQQR